MRNGLMKEKQMTTKSERMKIWNDLSKTDPNHTTTFKRAGGFSGTAIKPIWIVKMLTEQFGACGQGWGIGKPEFETVFGEEEALVYCTVPVWHTEPSNQIYGVGGDKMIAKRKSGKFHDDEAFKKAFTDAINNGFKFLGVGADVHMGLFDDSKYVTEMAAKFSDFPEGPAKTKTDLQVQIKKVHTAISNAGDGFEVNEIANRNEALFEQLEKALPQWWHGDGGDKIGLKKTIENKLEEFEQKEAA